MRSACRLDAGTKTQRDRRRAGRHPHTASGNTKLDKPKPVVASRWKYWAGKLGVELDHAAAAGPVHGYGRRTPDWRREDALKAYGWPGVAEAVAGAKQASRERHQRGADDDGEDEDLGAFPKEKPSAAGPSAA